MSTTLCNYHAGVIARAVRFHTHLTSKERKRMARYIANQCTDCAGLPSHVRPHMPRDPSMSQEDDE